MVRDPCYNASCEAIDLCSTIYKSDIQPSHGVKLCCAIVLADNDKLTNAKRAFYNQPQDDPDVMQLSYRVLAELQRLLSRRAAATSSNQMAQGFWHDQIEILDALQRLQEVDDSIN